MGAIDPRRLRLARELAGHRKKDLAELVELSPASITQYEAGRTSPPSSVTARIALVCGVSTGFFEAHEPSVPAVQSRPFFRSLRSTRQWERDEAEARAVVVWQITQAIEQRVDLPALALPDLHLAETAAPVEAAGRARELRDLWHLPDGPVGNVGRLVERHGGVVARVRGLTERVDAFSQWLDGRPFVILWRNKADTARSRFDAAHELGHLVMHPDPESGNKLLERQAHAFAAEFLMPADVIEHHLPRRPPRKTDLEALVESKKHWGVSIAALFYRSRELGLLSKESHRRSMIRLSELGYRTSEPGDLGELEMPALLRSALELTEKETGWGVGDLATELRLPTPLAREICGLDAEDRVAVDPLRFPDIREKGIDRSGRLSS